MTHLFFEYNINYVFQLYILIFMYLTSSMSDLSRNWKSVHNILITSFQTSMIMLEHRFKEKLLWSKLIRNISRNTLHYITDEVDRAIGCGMNKSKCGYLIFINYGLLCACTISKKTKHNTPFRLNEIYIHWKRLRLEYESDPKDRKEDIYLYHQSEIWFMYLFFF